MAQVCNHRLVLSEFIGLTTCPISQQLAWKNDGQTYWKLRCCSRECSICLNLGTTLWCCLPYSKNPGVCEPKGRSGNGLSHYFLPLTLIFPPLDPHNCGSSEFGGPGAQRRNAIPGNIVRQSCYNENQDLLLSGHFWLLFFFFLISNYWKF